MSIKIVIPARFGSTRLPGKPLKLIAGKTMIEQVVRRAWEAGFPSEDVIVATDHEAIMNVVVGFGGQCQMTLASHQSGTDRLAEVAQKLGWSDDEIVVNLQGDEPLMNPHCLTQVANALLSFDDAGISTLCTQISHPNDIFDPNIVKVVLDNRGFALYFSRAAIPWYREGFAASPVEVNPQLPVYRHLGLYGYRVSVLKQFTQWAPASIEMCESLEQLRAMANGVKIHVSITDKAPGHGVDTLEDLHRVERLLAE